MKTIERPSQKLIDVVLEVAEGEAHDKATPGMTYDGTATIFKLYHDWAEQQAALASLLPAAVKALEYYANPDTHWRSGFMPKTFEATGADAGEMARSTLTAISEATKAVEGN